MHRPVMESCESRCLLSVSVTTYHNDLSRTGANLQETILTTSNVRASKFGKKHSLQVDGQIYAQPLYVPNLVFQKNGRPVRRNMTYVATQNDTVYAYDADRGSLMWTAALLKRSVGETPVPNSDLGSDDINPVVGITSTPVIDQASDTMYVVAKAKRVTNGVASYVFRLYALDLNTGASKFGGPVTIHAAYPGNGDGSINGFTNFDAKIENQRSGLLLLNGVVYIAFASHGDQGPYHGWLLGYSASTLQQVKVWNDTANGDKGGIWQSGAAPSVDADGNIYLTIGNGASDAGTGGHNYGDSIVRIPTTGGQPFAPADFFTPHNHSDLENLDLDLGSTGVLLVPPRASGATPEAFFGGKEGNLYLVTRTNLGGFDSVNDNVIQIIGGQGRHGTFDSPAYYNNRVFFAASNGPLETLIIINGTASAGQQTAEHYGFPGVNPSISANGAGNGIVWVIAKGSDGHAILEAFSATNLSKKLYSSDTAGARDLPGDYVKFTTPTIADGKVIIGTGNELDVYGLL